MFTSHDHWELEEGERIVDRLRTLIMVGELLPGQPLRQAHIAARLQVSRVPVREALAELLAEGTVLHTPNVGYTVARFTLDDLRQIYRARALLEAEILCGVDAFSKGAIASMRLSNRRMHDAAQRGSVREFLIHNREFHFVGFRQSEKGFLINLVERLWNVSDFYRTLYLFDPDRLKETAREHDHLVALARSNAMAEFVQAIDAHRSKGMERLDLIARQSGHHMIALKGEIEVTR